MYIPFYDLKKTNGVYAEEFASALKNCLSEGQLVLGRNCKKFELDFANFTDNKYCIGVSNGLEALRLILVALDIKPYHNIIIPCHTFIATALAVNHCGAQIKLVPVDEDNYCLDSNYLEKYIDQNTKAIIHVHLYGHVINMEPILDIVKKYGIYLIEDAAQAHGASRCGVKVGNYGIASAYSFYPTKNLGALGDGGAVCTDDINIFEKLLQLRNYGSVEKYIHNSIGSNSRLDEIQAAFLCVKLKDLEINNIRRKEIANKYLNEIKNDVIKLPPSNNLFGDAWHVFVIRCIYREKLINYLSNHGIETLIHYPSFIFEHNAFKELHLQRFNSGITKEVLSIPNAHYLDNEEIEYIIETINNF